MKSGGSSNEHYFSLYSSAETFKQDKVFQVQKKKKEEKHQHNILINILLMKLILFKLLTRRSLHKCHRGVENPTSIALE